MNLKLHAKLKLVLLGLLMLLLIPSTVSALTRNDAFGYVAVDSSVVEEGVTFFFENISGTGTALGLGDDGASDVINLTFGFRFYENQSANALVICNNGFLTFDTAGGGCSPVNEQVPALSENASIYVYWDDICDATGDVYYEEKGVAPNRYFIVQWNRDVFEGSCHSGDPLDVQVILYENTSDIRMNYRDVNVTGILHDNGTSATVGIEGFNDSYFLNWSFNDDVIQNNYSIVFRYPANKAPNVTLNSPIENGKFWVPEIPFNITGIENDPRDNITLSLFASTKPNPGATDLIFTKQMAQNNTPYTFNWSTPVFQNDSDVQLLLHFDNRSEFGENNSHVYDFSGRHNGSVQGNPIFNDTDGKIGGSYVGDGSGDRINITICGYDCYKMRNATYMGWVKTASESGANPIMGSFGVVSQVGFAIYQSGAFFEARGDSFSGPVDADFFTGETDNWVHFIVTKVFNGSGVNVTIYKNTQEVANGHMMAIFDASSLADFWVAETDGLQSNNYWNGSLDEIVIINRTLTHEERVNAYQLQKDKYYWYVDVTDGSNTTRSQTQQFILNNSAPNVTINAPVNNSNFTAGPNLSITALDSDIDDLVNISIYGSSDPTPNSAQLLFRRTNVSPSTFIHNWSAPVLDYTSQVLLAHFDNRPEYGEEISGTVVDFSGTENGTVVGLVFGDDLGKIAGAYEFFGGEWFDFGSQSSRIGRNHTYLFWVKPNILTGTQDIFGKWNAGTGLLVTREGADLIVNGEGTNVTASSFFTDTDWVHVGITIDTSEANVYKNGALFSGDTTGFVTDPGTNLFIGGNLHYSNFEGQIDEFAVYDTVLASDAIQNTVRLQDGTYYWYVNITDGLETVQNETYQFTIDTQAPTMSIDSPQNITYAQSTLDFNVSANEPIHTWWYEYNSNGTNITFTPNTTFIASGADGNKHITIYANDSVGNSNQVTVFFTLDTTPPTITHEFPQNQSYDIGTLDYNITVNEALSTAFYSVDGSTNDSLLNDSVFHYYNPAENHAVLFDGPHTIEFFVNDTAGNVNFSRIGFTVDTSSPEVTILNPQPGNYSNTTINFTASIVEANNDTALFQLTHDSVSTNYTATNQSGIWNYTNTSLADGSYTLQVFVNDTAGNENTSEQVTFTIDTLPPTIILDSPQNTTYSQIVIDLNVSANENIDAWWYQYNSNGTNTTFIPNTTFIAGGGDGNKHLTVYANDSAGNENSSTVFFTLETAIPTANISSPVSGEIIINQNYTDVRVNFTGDNVTVRLFNASKSLINSTVGISSPLVFDSPNLTPGIYYINATPEVYYFNGTNPTPTINFQIAGNGIANGSINSIRIADGVNGFSPSNLDSGDFFGYSLANIGDLDGDGVQDVAVGARNDENFESGEGAIYILFLNDNGTVKSNVKISDGLGGFTPSGLTSNDQLGNAIANLGDVDRDGIQDLAVGAPQDENSESGEGAVYILFMNSNGTVRDNIKISDGLNGFSPSGLDISDGFGYSIANIGDLDLDGIPDVAVGALLDENTESGEGAIYILFLNSDGTEKSHTKISDGIGGFNPVALNGSDQFGSALANIGDLDGDGTVDLVVGAFFDEHVQSSEGAFYILFMNTNGTVKNHVKLANGTNGFIPPRQITNCCDYITNLGDLDGDGIQDLGTGRKNTETNMILHMHTNGSVKNIVTIVNISGLGLSSSMTNIGDLNRDGIQDIGAGDHEESGGEIYIINLGIDITSPVIVAQSPTNTTYNNETIDLNVSADETIDGWLYSLNGGANTTFTPNTTITATEGSNLLVIHANDTFGNVDQLTIFFSLDTVAPTITHESPLNQTYRTGGLDYNISVNEQLSTAFFSIDGGQNTTLTNDSLTHYFDPTSNHPVLLDGRYTIEFFVNDTVGNANFSTVFFTVDFTPPEVTILNPQPGNYSNTTINFTASILEANSDTVLFQLTHDSVSTNYTATNRSGVWNYTNTSLAEGLYTLQIFANDTAGNVNNSAQVTFVIDATRPTIIIASPQNTTYNTDIVPADLNVIADELIHTWWYSLNGGSNITFTPNSTITGVEGSNLLLVYANDSAGNENFSLVYFTDDRTSPDITPNAPLNNGNLSDTNVTFNFTLTDNLDPEINYTLYIDESINQSGSIPNNTEVILSVTVSEGLHNWTVSVSDNGNNLATTLARPFTVDTQLPTIVITSPENITYSTGVIDIDVSADEEIQTWEYSINDTINQTFTPNTSAVFVQGANTVKVFATDYAGNQNVSEVSFTVSIPSAPQFSNVGVNTTIHGEIAQFTTEWTDALGLAGYIFSTNNTGVWVNDSFVSFLGTTNHSNITKQLNTSTGIHVGWEIFGFNTLNGSNTTGIQTLVTTNTPPQAANVLLTSTSPINGTQGNLIGNFTFVDNDTIDSQQALETRWFRNNIEIDSLRNVTIVTSGNTSRAENWIFSVRVFDGHEWSAFVNSTSLTIENTPPQLTQLETFFKNYSASSTFPVGAKVVFRAIATDPDGESDLDSAIIVNITDADSSLRISDTDMVQISPVTNGFQYEYNFSITTLSLGSWIIQVRVNDTQSTLARSSININVFQPPLRVPDLYISLHLNQSQNSIYIPGQGTFTFAGLPAATYTTPSQFYLASFRDDALYGLVHSQKIPVSLSTAKDAENHTLTVSQELPISQTFLVFSRGTQTSIDKRIPLIKSGEFLTNSQPTFSYGLGPQEGLIRLGLDYPTLDIQKTSVLREGNYRVVIESLGVQGGQEVIRINPVV